MRMSRSGAFVGGVVCALVVGAGTAVAATSTGLVGGRNNTEQATTGLTDTKGTPLSLTAKKGVAPLKVSNRVKVNNLNSDLLDGKSANDFLPSQGRAADSSELGGQPAAAFLPAGGTATDASRLGGQPPSAYTTSVYAATTSTQEAAVRLDPVQFLDTVTLPPGTYSVAVTATLENQSSTTEAASCLTVFGTLDVPQFDGVQGLVTLPGYAGAVPYTITPLAFDELITVAHPTSASLGCQADPPSAALGHTSYVISSSLVATRITDFHGTAEQIY